MFKIQNKKIIIFAGIVFALMFMAVLLNSANDQNSSEILRPGKNEESREETINVSVDGLKDLKVTFDVLPQEYSKEEISALFNEVYNEIKQEIIGSNESLEKVTDKLNLVTQYKDYPVTIEWYSSDYSVVDFDGTVYNTKFEKGQKKNIELKMVLEYEEISSSYSINICVCEPDYKNDEQKKAAINEIILEAGKENRNGEYVKLPDEFNGKKIEYSYDKNKSEGLILVILACVAAVCIYLKKYEDAAKIEKQRKNELMYEYSELISKLTLLTGAGMTVRSAWEKIVYDYKQSGTKKKVVYEEMIHSAEELKAGVSEKVVYERFGKRCDLREYMKLASILAQNVKKGSTDLIRILENESYDAFEKHKAFARSKGEEAGTKLLLPMIIMLAIVMVIVMYPALISFQI